MFDLNVDLAVVNAALSTEPAMSRLVVERPALRVFGGWDPFEVAMRTINGQQVSVERARHLNGVLVARRKPVLFWSIGTAYSTGRRNVMEDHATRATTATLNRPTGGESYRDHRRVVSVSQATPACSY